MQTTRILSHPDKTVESILTSRGMKSNITCDVYFVYGEDAFEGIFISKNGCAAFPHGFVMRKGIENKEQIAEIVIHEVIQYCLFNKIKFLWSAAKKDGILQKEFVKQGFIIEEGYVSGHMIL